MFSLSSGRVARPHGPASPSRRWPIERGHRGEERLGE
jgi:hypothetical protein